jgi:hypothetical protein
MRFLFKSVLGRPRFTGLVWLTKSGDYIGNKTVTPLWYGIYGNWWN